MPTIRIKCFKDLIGIVVLQVDDSLSHGTEDLFELEENESKELNCRQRSTVEPEWSVRFNECSVSVLENNDYQLLQSSRLSNSTELTSKDEFVSTPTLLQYMGGGTRPDIFASFQDFGRSSDDSSKDEYGQLEKIVEHCRQTTSRSLV